MSNRYDEREELRARQLAAQLEGKTPPDADEESTALAELARSLPWEEVRPHPHFRHRLRRDLLRRASAPRPRRPWYENAAFIYAGIAVVALILRFVLLWYGPTMSYPTSYGHMAYYNAQPVLVERYGLDQPAYVKAMRLLPYGLYGPGFDPTVVYELGRVDRSTTYSLADQQYELPQQPAQDEEQDARSPAHQPSPPSPSTERMVIQTAQLAIIVDDVEETLPQVHDLVQRTEGYIVHSSSYRTTTDRLAATVTLRVPVDRFDEALDQLRALGGKITREEVSGEDVTDQYVDLEARLKALQATEEQLLALLDDIRQSEGNAQQKTQAILSMYNQVTSVRTQIEQIQGQMRYLEQLSAMATITVELSPREPEIVQPVLEEEGFDIGRTFNDAARTLVGILESLVQSLIYIGVVLLPLAALIAVPVGLIVWWLRRRRKRIG